MKTKLIATLLVLAAACTPNSEETRGALEQSVTAFQNGLRWQRCEQTSALLDQPLRAEFVDACENLSGRLGIEDMRVMRIEVDAAAGTAEVDVRVTYYLLPDNTLAKATTHLLWKKTGELWLLQKADGAFFGELFTHTPTSK
jgi:hypothetical protein